MNLEIVVCSAASCKACTYFPSPYGPSQYMHAQLKRVENVCNPSKAISSFQSAYKLYGIEMLKDWAFQKYIIFGVLLTPSDSYKKAFAKAGVMPGARSINISKYQYKLIFGCVVLYNTFKSRDKCEKMIIIGKNDRFLYENATFWPINANFYLKNDTF